MPVTARSATDELLVKRQQPATYVEDIMREWLVIAVGIVIGLTTGILVGEAFELSRVVAKIVALSCTVFGGCLAMGLATMIGWVKPLSDNT
jgi:putative effector of murein hydrolase